MRKQILTIPVEATKADQKEATEAVLGGIEEETEVDIEVDKEVVGAQLEIHNKK